MRKAHSHRATLIQPSKIESCLFKLFLITRDGFFLRLKNEPLFYTDFHKTLWCRSHFLSAKSLIWYIFLRTVIGGCLQSIIIFALIDWLFIFGGLRLLNSQLNKLVFKFLGLKILNNLLSASKGFDHLKMMDSALIRISSLHELRHPFKQTPIRLQTADFFRKVIDECHVLLLLQRLPPCARTFGSFFYDDCRYAEGPLIHL